MALSKPIIRQLTIERFRGLQQLSWNPEPGINVILGSGDVGKTTILEAIALLLSPTSTVVLSDADYWNRDTDSGFFIEAVMTLPETCGINQQTKIALPWEWDGHNPRLPKVNEECSLGSISEEVYRIRVRGTADFDLEYEIFQPDDTVNNLSVAVRRKIGLIRLSGDDRNDRDLRLVQGSALDRLVSDKTLRSRLGNELSKVDIEKALKSEAKNSLKSLDTAFKELALPSGLGLGLTGGQGLPFNALIGLTASKGSVRIPLASWGAGTRRLASLKIASINQGESPITLVDEVERGFEPYRQRVLMSQLSNGGSQIFLTTHSVTVLQSALTATFWYMDEAGRIAQLNDKLVTHLKRDPETFLSRIAIIAEGQTEVGFVESLLKRAIGNNLLDYGIWITDGVGNQNTLELLEALTEKGLQFGCFADNEGTAPTKWAAVAANLKTLLFRWPTGCVEQNIINLVPDDRLEKFIEDANGDSGDRLRTLAERLGIKDKDYFIIKAQATDLRKLIIEAATGAIPETKKDASKEEKKSLKKHSEKWFKSVEGGHELALKIFDFDLWEKFEAQLLPFLNAVRKAVALPEISKLKP